MTLPQQQDLTARAEHHIEVQLVRERIPELEREVIELGGARQHIVGAHDRRVAPDIAGADITLFQHGDVADAKLLGKVVGRCKTMATTANDDGVVMVLRCGIAPGTRPGLAGDGMLQERERGIARHWALYAGCSMPPSSHSQRGKSSQRRGAG